MNGSEEKESGELETSSFPAEPPKNSAEQAARLSSEEEAATARPVRMKWGRVVEESPEEPAPSSSEEQSASKPMPPKPDPRIEALRERLARAEQEEREARAQRERKEKNAEAQAAETESASARNHEDKTPPRKSRERSAGRRSAAQKTPASPEVKETVKATDRRINASDARREAEENERMREELEREALLKKIRKKRRKENLRAICLGILGGIWALLRRIRISKRLMIGILVTVLLSGLSAVILGNLLRSRVGTLGDDSESTVAPETEAETVPPARGLEIPELNAGVVSLEGATAKSLRSEAQRFANAGVTAVSLILRNGNGQLLFSAETDDALDLETETAGLLRISEILEPFLSREIYVSCILPMRYFTDGNDYSRSVLYAYETALLCEVAEAGAEEVVLLDCDGLFDLSGEEAADGVDPAFEAVDAVRELQRIARAVNERAPMAAVGIAFSPDFLATRDSDRYLGSIVETFDLLLLDLRAAENAEDLYQEVSLGVSDHLYFILRYSMRVLIPQGSAEAVTRVSVGNWQEGTVRTVSADKSE